MKKNIYSVISILIILFLSVSTLGGCGESQSVPKERSSDSELINAKINPTEAIENNPTETIEKSVIEADFVEQMEPIIWYSDITQDGIDEKIEVDLTYVINHPNTGEEQTVSVYSGSTGDLIWTGHADTVHPGWNGIYIYSDGDNEYLLNWKPTIYQDSADFFFHVFSLTEEGDVQELTTETIQFNILGGDECDTDAISSYIDKVNSYLENSYVLVDTENGTPLYSTKNNKINNCYDVSAILNEIKN